MSANIFFRSLSSTVVVAAMVAQAADASTALTASPEPRRYTLTFESGGRARTAHVHIPIGYTVAARPPLVLMLHCAGGNGSDALDQYGWAVKADQAGFIVVAPDALPVPAKFTAIIRAQMPLWNSGPLPTTSTGASDDTDFIRKLLDVLKAKVPYDEGRVFCTGHSNGGGMAFRLAAELSERFTAIGIVAGVLTVDDPRPTKPLPTLYILGTNDPLLPPDGGELSLPWGKRTIPPVAEMLAKWADAMGCESAPRTLLVRDGAVKVEYPSKSQGSRLTAIYLEGHGHHWPGARQTLPENIVGPIVSRLNATDMLWEFFQSSGADSLK